MARHWAHKMSSTELMPVEPLPSASAGAALKTPLNTSSVASRRLPTHNTRMAQVRLHLSWYRPCRYSGRIAHAETAYRLRKTCGVSLITYRVAAHTVMHDSRWWQ